MNKRIPSIIAIGVIVILVIVLGLLFLVNNKKTQKFEINQNSNIITGNIKKEDNKEEKKETQMEQGYKLVKANTDSVDLSFEIPINWAEMHWKSHFEKLSVTEKGEFLQWYLDLLDPSKDEIDNFQTKILPVVSVSEDTIFSFSTIQWNQLNFYLKSYNENSFRTKEMFDGSYKNWSKIKIGEKNLYFNPNDKGADIVGLGEYIIEIGESDLLKITAYAVTVSDDADESKKMVEFTKKITKIIETLKVE